MRLGLLPLHDKYIPEPMSGCWLWIGAVSVNGYGKLKVNRRTKLAHRVVYEDLVGPIPAGLTLDHLCRNRQCVNPRHLEPVTLRINTLRGETVTARAAARTTCPAGHPYDRVLYRNARGCSVCRLAQWAKYRERNRALLCEKKRQRDARRREAKKVQMLGKPTEADVLERMVP